MLRNKRVLITGGAGFIGSSLAKILADDNELVLVDHTFHTNAFQYTNLSDLPNVSTCDADIRDVEAMKQVTKGCDIVVHAAAVLGVNKVRKESRLTLETNYHGTSNVLQAAVNAGSVKQFLFLSTSEIFGPSCFRVSENGGISLDSVSEARWCYLISKLAGENLTRSYSEEYGLPITIVRPFNIYGPGRIGDYVLNHFIRNALNERPIVIHGDGTQIRSWCYISDILDALVSCLVNPTAQNNVFNIGNPQATLTIYDLALRIIAQTRSTSDLHFEAPEFVDIDVRVPTIQKARDLLNFEPQVGIDEGIGHTIRWFRETQFGAGRRLINSDAELHPAVSM